MKTPYLDMPTSVADALAYFRQLFEHPEYESTKVIACGYTIPEKELKCEEPILNLKWSLVGDFKYVYLTDIYSPEKSIGELGLLNSYSHDFWQYNNRLDWLFNHPKAKDFSVSGLNFDDGVMKLLALAQKTFLDPIDRIQCSQKGIRFFDDLVLIKREGDRNFFFHKAFAFGMNENSKSGFYPLSTFIPILV